MRPATPRSLEFITLDLDVAGFLRISFGIMDAFQA
jgi:hypothetical protein